MNIGALIGLVLGVGILGFAAFMGATDQGVAMGKLWDYISLLIVVGGSLAATCIAYPLSDVLGSLKGLIKIFKGDNFTKKDIIQDYVNLAEQARKGELAKALEETPEHMSFRLHFIKDGLRYITEGYSKDDIRSMLENQEQYRAIREIKAANAMAKLGEYAPSFGMIGTLFGLVFMLGGMAVPPPPGVDPTAKLVGAMAIALLTTLYGAMFAFFLFNPLADHMKYINEEKKVESALGLEGTMLLFDKIHPLMVQDKLNVFLYRKDRFTDDG